jgi:pyrroline-5-carboxylate reductase
MDSALDSVYEFLGNLTLGIFGAGHLGRVIAQGLLDAGLRRSKLVLCHRGSGGTNEALAQAKLAELVVDPRELVRQSKLLLYVVRPQDYMAIGSCTPREDCVLLSFLAGVPLARLPVLISDAQRVRVMTSAPDTLRKKIGIAAVYPASNVLVNAILRALQLRVVALRREADVHAFTAFGPCLSIALTYWEGLGREVNESELVETAQKFELPSSSDVIRWARAVQPRSLSEAERSLYISEARTPGGVTEAMLRAIELGESISVALERGVHRSRELAAA